MNRHRSNFARAFVPAILAIGLAATAACAAETPPAGDPGGEKLIPLPTVLPKFNIIGTPKKFKPAPTLEPQSDKPRATFYVPEGVTNLAADKKVTAGDPSPEGELSLITDGDKCGLDGTVVELGPGKQWVQIDLGAAADVYAVLVWHYHTEQRIYHDVIVQVADDPEFAKGVQTIFNNDFDNSAGLGPGTDLEYVDDNRGKLIAAKDRQGRPVRGRYVRLYSNGNTSNDLNHYCEVEVFGKPAK